MIELALNRRKAKNGLSDTPPNPGKVGLGMGFQRLR
jgi:hypothetical protein